MTTELKNILERLETKVATHCRDCLQQGITKYETNPEDLHRWLDESIKEETNR